MENDMDKLKKYALPVGIVLAVFLVYSAVVRSCDIRDGYSVALGEYKAKAAYAKLLTARRTRENVLLYQYIMEQDEKITAQGKDIDKKNKVIGALSRHQAELEGDLSAAKTDAERVPILTGLVDTWRNKYDTLTGVVADKDIQLGAWAEKYVTLEKVAGNYKELWEDAEGRVVALDKVRKKLETDLRISRVGGKLKTYVIIAAVGVGYTLIRKD